LPFAPAGGRLVRRNRRRRGLGEEAEVPQQILVAEPTILREAFRQALEDGVDVRRGDTKVEERRGEPTMRGCPSTGP